MTTCQERVISRPQVGGRLDSMAPGGLFQLCDSDTVLPVISLISPLKHPFLVLCCPRVDILSTEAVSSFNQIKLCRLVLLYLGLFYCTINSFYTLFSFPKGTK